MSLDRQSGNPGSIPKSVLLWIKVSAEYQLTLLYIKTKLEQTYMDAHKTHTCTHKQIRKTVWSEDLLSPKVNVEPSLQELVGHQRDSELGRGAEHSSWRAKSIILN